MKRWIGMLGVVWICLMGMPLASCDQAGSSEPRPPDTVVTIAIDNAGQIMVDGQSMTAEQLKTKLAGLDRFTTQIKLYSANQSSAQSAEVFKVIGDSGIMSVDYLETPP